MTTKIHFVHLWNLSGLAQDMLTATLYSCWSSVNTMMSCPACLVSLPAVHLCSNAKQSQGQMFTHLETFMIQKESNFLFDLEFLLLT